MAREERPDTSDPDAATAELFRSFKSQFMAFADLIPQMVWTADPDGRIRWLSDNWYAYSGADPEAATGEGAFAEFLHPADVAEAQARYREAIARQEPWDDLVRLRGRDGAYRWFLSRARPLREDDGAVSRWFGTHTDVHERYEAAAELRASEERQRALIETLPQLVWSCGEDGLPDYLSAQWETYTGQPTAQLLGVGWTERVLHPDDHVSLRRHWEGVQAGLHPFDTEYRLRRHDGAWRWFKARARPLAGADGRPHWLGANTDIQEIVEARTLLEEEAAENALERRRLFSASSDLLATAGYDGLLRSINPAWSRLLGWSEAELTARPFSELIHRDDRAATLARVAELRQGQPVGAFETRVRVARGGYVRIEWTASGGEDRFYVVGRDVNEARRAAEELERAQAALRQAHKMEAIGQLTGGVAHDFNNLLTAISGNLELLQRRLARGDADVGRFAEGALSSTRRAAILTQRLLAFSRRQALEPRLVDVNAVVLGMDELIRRSVGDHIRVAVRPTEGELNAWCDPSQLENALLNLAINARDAMPDGGELTVATGAVTIRLVSVDDPDAAPPELASGDYVRLSVIDTGVGMTAEVAERAFDPFFTTKPLGQGTGLGLSQIYGFARQSGGMAEIRSSPGKGAMISLYLPRRDAEAEAAPDRSAAAAAPAAPAAPVGQGRAITVVEDEALVRAAVVQALTEEGFRIDAFDTPMAALVHLQGGAPCDLLVTDIGLPGMSGRALAAAVRQARPGMRVLFVTGYEHEAQPGAEPQAEEEGCDLLRKPFAIDELARRVARLLEGAGTPAAIDA